MASVETADGSDGKVENVAQSAGAGRDTTVALGSTSSPSRRAARNTGPGFALLRRLRRLRIRREIGHDIHEALLRLACAIICWRRLVNLSLRQQFLTGVGGKRG